MFAHIYTHRLKCQLRDRSTLFWSILFPIVLATFFFLALSNAYQGNNFSEIPIAVVNNTAYRQDTTFQQAIHSVSTEHVDGSKALFSVKLLSQSKADNALKNNTIEGYILPGGTSNDMRVVIKENGIDQTILKAFMDQYLQDVAAYKDITSQNPTAIRTAMQVKTLNFIRSVPLSKSAPKPVSTNYFALIAMACLYGSFWGMREINAIQANQSTQGARVNMAPVHKTRVFLASLCAALTVQTAGAFLLIGYLNFALGVNFGSQTGYILLTAFASSATGVLFGAMVSSLLKVAQGLKVALLIGISMVLSFLSGLMYYKMIYIVGTSAPIVNHINPGALTVNAFYSLSYYDTLDQYWVNVGSLFILAGIFFAVTYFALRRQKYESL